VRRFASSHPAAASFLGYFLLSVVLTWPLAVRIGCELPLGDNDLWQNYWNAWWWQRSIERGESAFHTDLLFHPTGASLGWHTHSPANVIAALPAAWIARWLGLDGPAAALTAATFAGFVLAAWGAHLLARELVAPGGPAVVAGIVFGFFPQHAEQSLEHLNLASYWAIPFALLYLARAARGRGRISWIGAGFFLALNALLSWHNAVLLLFTALAVVGAELKRAQHRARGLVSVGLASLLCLLLILPFLWPMIAEALQGGGGFKDPTHKPIDPLFLVVPHSGHPLWGGAVADLYERFRPYPAAGFVSYLGISVITLWTAAGAWRPRVLPAPGATGRGIRPWGPFLFWSALALFHLVLALGRSLRTGGVDFPSLKLPFALLDEVPVLNTVRVANRFLVPAMLAVSMLAAMGSAAVLAHLPGGPRRKRVAAAVFAALIAFDYLWLPYPLRSIPEPAWLPELAKLPPGLAVLDIPSGVGPRAAEDMFLQTRHGRPIAGGYVSRTPPEIEKTIAEHPVLNQIFLAHPPPPPPRETLTAAIRALGVGIVVLHLDRQTSVIEAERELSRDDRPGDLYTARIHNPEKGIAPGDFMRIRTEIRSEFGPAVYEGSEVEIYLVRK